MVDSSGARRADLAAIHIAKKALQLDDDAYRDLIFTVCRVRSSANLDFAGRKRFLAHLQACLGRPGEARAASAPRAPWGPQLRLLWSLWQKLADAKLVANRERKALESWVKRQTGVDRLEWLTSAQLDMTLDSAKRWLSRKAEC